MNNSQLIVENVDMEMPTPVDTTPMLREQSIKLEKIIEAFDKINGSIYWKLLQREIFDGVLESLNRRMRNEKDVNQLLKLQGQIVWADKYCNLTKLADVYKKELVNITNKLK